MTLTRCTEYWGTASLMHGDPPTIIAHNVIYMPYSAGACWGLYRSDGTIIEESVDFRGQERELRNQVISPIEIPRPKFEMATECLYGGYISNHFGHFLVNTLSRLWPYYLVNRRVKIIFHGDANSALALPFVRTILGALNIDWTLIETPKECVLLKNVIIPSTSFIEQKAIYTIYGDLCREIARRLGVTTTSADTKGLAYISKTKLHAGVGRFANESILEAHMREAGIEIVYPENLTLTEQIQKIIDHRLIVGTTGSFFHNSAFSPIHRHFICLNSIPNINSNFVLIDQVSGCNVEYYYPAGTEYTHGKDNFITQAEVSDMNSVAHQLLEIIFRS